MRKERRSRKMSESWRKNLIRWRLQQLPFSLYHANMIMTSTCLRALPYARLLSEWTRKKKYSKWLWFLAIGFPDDSVITLTLSTRQNESVDNCVSLSNSRFIRGCPHLLYIARTLHVSNGNLNRPYQTVGKKWRSHRDMFTLYQVLFASCKLPLEIPNEQLHTITANVKSVKHVNRKMNWREHTHTLVNRRSWKHRFFPPW